MSTHAEKIAAARRKAEEMKAAAAAKRLAHAKRRQEGDAAAADDSKHEIFVPGEHSVVLIDWDDTLFPTSAWKNRVREGASPPSERKVQLLSQAISGFIRTLQQSGEVKIVTHACKGWYEKSSAVLLPETKALLDSLPARYRDSYGSKYMKPKPAGHKYMTTIGSEVDNYAEWYKTDMFFSFISEKKQARSWDESHLPERVALPRQVLVVGDGSAEKRSYDELGNQAQLYASRPGHAAVGRVGLKGVFFRDGPSFDELLLQLRWATDSVASTFLPPADCRTTMWDLYSSFPEWVRLDKAGANAYQPVSRGMLVGVASAAEAAAAREAAAAAAAAEEEERAVQEAIELSLRS